MNSKEFHWYEEEYDLELDVSTYNRSLGYRETAWVVKHEADCIRTDQSAFLSTSLLDKGYRIFIHFASGDVVEIKYGKNNCTSREIRPEHNLEKLLLAGEFGELSC